MAAASTCVRVMRSLCSRWMSLVAMKVWMRPRSASRTSLPGNGDVLLAGPRQRSDNHIGHLVGNRADRLEVAR